MEINNIILTVGGLIVANYGVKFGRALPLVKKAYDLMLNQVEARKDKKLTLKEKAGLYDDIESLIAQAWSIMKGLFPNRSK